MVIETLFILAVGDTSSASEVKPEPTALQKSLSVAYAKPVSARSRGSSLRTNQSEDSIASDSREKVSTHQRSASSVASINR